MPQTKQAKIALKKNIRNQERNKLVKATIKTFLKKSRQTLEKGDKNAKSLIKDSIKKIDKAVQKGVLKKNAGARKKSRLIKAMNKTVKKDK